MFIFYILNHANSVPRKLLPIVPPPIANVAPVVIAKAAAATVPNAMPSFVTNAAMFNILFNSYSINGLLNILKHFAQYLLLKVLLTRISFANKISFLTTAGIHPLTLTNTPVKW